MLIVGSMIVFPNVIHCGPESGAVLRAMSDAKDVGMAAHAYAQEHQGRLPETVRQLVQYWATNEKRFARTHLTVPGVLLKDLPPKSIIFVKAFTDPKRKETRLVFVHADGSVALEPPERYRDQRESTSQR